MKEEKDAGVLDQGHICDHSALFEVRCDSCGNVYCRECHDRCEECGSASTIR